MNNKHIAAFLVLALSLGLFQVTLMMKKEMDQANARKTQAITAFNAATSTFSSTQAKLKTFKNDTAATLTFGARWSHDIEKTGSEQKAKQEFDRQLKKFPQLVRFSSSSTPPAENKDNAYLRSRVGNNIKLEGDYLKVIELMSSFERELPASRISDVLLKKGAKKNDVELNLAVEFPQVAPQIK